MTRTIVTDEDIAKLKRLWPDKSLSMQDIADQFRCCEAVARKRGAALGLPKRGHPIRTPVIEDTPEFRADWAGPMKNVELAAKYRCSTTAVTQAAKRIGLPSRRGRRPPVGRGHMPKVRVTACPSQPALRAVPSHEVKPNDVPLMDEFWTADRLYQVQKTQGKWAKLAALADTWGVPLLKVQQCWHRLRAAA